MGIEKIITTRRDTGIEAPKYATICMICCWNIIIISASDSIAYNKQLNERPKYEEIPHIVNTALAYGMCREEGNNTKQIIYHDTRHTGPLTTTHSVQQDSTTLHSTRTAHAAQHIDTLNELKQLSHTHTHTHIQDRPLHQ